MLRAAAYQRIMNMNRHRAIDPNSELDVLLRACDPSVMIAQGYRLRIQRIDPSKNMAHYYELSLQPTLLGDTSLVRTWGRIGRGGQQRVELSPTERQAAEMLLKLLRKNGLKVVSQPRHRMLSPLNIRGHRYASGYI